MEDSKYNEIAESPPPAFYLPFSQYEQANTTFVVRSQRAQNEIARIKALLDDGTLPKPISGGAAGTRGCAG